MQTLKEIAVAAKAGVSIWALQQLFTGGLSYWMGLMYLLEMMII